MSCNSPVTLKGSKVQRGSALWVLVVNLVLVAVEKLIYSLSVAIVGLGEGRGFPICMTSLVTNSKIIKSFHTHCKMEGCCSWGFHVSRSVLLWESVHELLNDQLVSLGGCVVEGCVALLVHLGGLGPTPEQVSHTTGNGN